MNTLCQECGKPLKSIGTARKNGKCSHPDWANREYHKCCWKKLQGKEHNDNLQNTLRDEIHQLMNNLKLKSYVITMNTLAL